MRHDDIQARYASSRGLFELWTGFLLAPLAWALHLAVSYFFAGFFCNAGRLALWSATTVALAIALTGAGFAFRNYSATGRQWPKADEEGVLVGGRFLAVGGLLLAAISVLLIAVQTIPTFILQPCS